MQADSTVSQADSFKKKKKKKHIKAESTVIFPWWLLIWCDERKFTHVDESTGLPDGLGHR